MYSIKSTKNVLAVSNINFLHIDLKSILRSDIFNWWSNELKSLGRFNAHITDLIEKKLGIKDIIPIFCQRVGSPQNSKNGSVLIHFTSCADRNLIFYQKKKLKSIKISMVEELREKYGEKAVWTMGGKGTIFFF